MQKKDFMKLFNNQNMWNNIKKIDKKTDILIKSLNNILIIEIFDKLYKDFSNHSIIEITEIKSQLIEINSLLYERKLVIACRRLKGFMEDCLMFICQNFNQNGVTIDINTKAGDYRKYILDNNSKIFSMLNEEIENNYLNKIYTYIAKIDHNTSLTIYTKNLQNYKQIKNIQYSYFSIVNFLIFLLFDFIYTLNKSENSGDSLFIIKTLTNIDTIILISYIRNYDKKKYLDIKLSSKMNNPDDEEYINNLNEWNKRICTDFQNSISEEDIKIIQGFFACYDDELRIRGYLK